MTKEQTVKELRLKMKNLKMKKVQEVIYQRAHIRYVQIYMNIHRYV
jgi:hypothetical protein